MTEFRSVVPEPEPLVSASQASRSEAFGSSSEEEAAEEEASKPVQASKSHSSQAIGILYSCYDILYFSKILNIFDLFTTFHIHLTSSVSLV